MVRLGPLRSAVKHNAPEIPLLRVFAMFQLIRETLIATDMEARSLNAERCVEESGDG